MLCLHDTAVSAQRHATRNLLRKIEHRIKALRLQRLEKLPGLLLVEMRICRFDSEKESVLRRAFELRHVKQRMMGFGQAVYRQHPERSGESCKKDREFKRHDDKRGPAVERPAADVERIGENRRVVLHGRA